MSHNHMHVWDIFSNRFTETCNMLVVKTYMHISRMLDSIVNMRMHT